MPAIINSRDVAHTPNGNVRFEGEGYQAPVSVFVIADAPGAPGPPLHVHPYVETWIVQHGSARFVAGDSEYQASAGDIVVVEAHTPHKFRNSGNTTLELVCIHPSPRILQTDLE